jgi:hypothetical protein
MAVCIGAPVFVGAVQIFLGRYPGEVVVKSLHASLAVWVGVFVAWMVWSVGRLVLQSGRDGLIGRGLFLTLCMIAFPALQELGSITNNP